MLGGRLENLREHQLRRRLLLILAVVLLDLALVVLREPVDAIRVAQFSDGLGIHLLVGDLPQHVDLARHLHAEVASGAVAGGQRRGVIGGGDERAEAWRHRILV